MFRITLKEYNAIHQDYRGEWGTERTDLKDWDCQRDQYMGKRTLMRGGALLVEGVSFEITEAP